MSQPSASTVGVAVTPSRLSRADRQARERHPRFGGVSLFCAWALTPTEMLATGSAEASSPAPTVLDGHAVVVGEVTALRPPARPRTILLLRDTPPPLPIWHLEQLRAVPYDNLGPFLVEELGAVCQVLITRARMLASTHTSTPTTPLYFTLHLGSLLLPKDWPTPGRKGRLAAGGVLGASAAPPPLGDKGFRALMAVLREVRLQQGIPLADTPTGGGPARESAYFEHYSLERQRRGYLVLDPWFSLVADCAEADAVLLLWMAQQSAIEPNGLAALSYSSVLTRVSLWDANADTGAALDEMNRQGNASTQGQVLLNFALAGIGILLALTQVPGARPAQLVAPMLLFAVAALCHTGTAWLNKPLFTWLGIAFLVAAAGLAVLLFVDPALVLPWLPNTLTGVTAAGH